MTKIHEDSEDELAEIEIAEAKRAEQEKIKNGQRLYARIKTTSKYYGQGERDALFPVFVMPGGQYSVDYLVRGGPGGQYRLEDVSLFVVEDSCDIQIS